MILRFLLLVFVKTCLVISSRSLNIISSNETTQSTSHYYNIKFTEFGFPSIEYFSGYFSVISTDSPKTYLVKSFYSYDSCQSILLSQTALKGSTADNLFYTDSIVDVSHALFGSVNIKSFGYFGYPQYAQTEDKGMLILDDDDIVPFKISTGTQQGMFVLGMYFSYQGTSEPICQVQSVAPSISVSKTATTTAPTTTATSVVHNTSKIPSTSFYNISISINNTKIFHGFFKASYQSPLLYYFTQTEFTTLSVYFVQEFYSYSSSLNNKCNENLLLTQNLTRNVFASNIFETDNEHYGRFTAAGVNINSFLSIEDSPQYLLAGTDIGYNLYENDFMGIYNMSSNNLLQSHIVQMRFSKPFEIKPSICNTQRVSVTPSPSKFPSTSLSSTSSSNIPISLPNKPSVTPTYRPSTAVAKTLPSMYFVVSQLLTNTSVSEFTTLGTANLFIETVKSLVADNTVIVTIISVSTTSVNTHNTKSLQKKVQVNNIGSTTVTYQVLFQSSSPDKYALLKQQLSNSAMSGIFGTFLTLLCRKVNRCFTDSRKIIATSILSISTLSGLASVQPSLSPNSGSGGTQDDTNSKSTLSKADIKIAIAISVSIALCFLCIAAMIVYRHHDRRKSESIQQQQSHINNVFIPNANPQIPNSTDHQQHQAYHDDIHPIENEDEQPFPSARSMDGLISHNYNYNSNYNNNNYNNDGWSATQIPFHSNIAIKQLSSSSLASSSSKSSHSGGRTFKGVPKTILKKVSMHNLDESVMTSKQPSEYSVQFKGVPRTVLKTSKNNDKPITVDEVEYGNIFENREASHSIFDNEMYNN